ncbi:tyrosinase family protein [Fodinibacter luteus]|uniref:Tyrosinase family protein n=2 Tax=Fodinibacter luteus TaxID=552064 RepID=A0ABP8K801_9MICO
MDYVRRNVWELGGDWADEVLWYARGVAAMKAKPLADPTSWRFYAGMHGFNQARWVELGYLSASDQPPTQAQLTQFWRQCQHGSWYFLPWHRGYVLAFEANIRAVVQAQGGPSDWALPYWDYFGTDQAALPPAFASPDWPDGVGDNPLFVSQRYGPNGDGDVFVPLDQVNLAALGDPNYTGVSGGGSPGFGGVDTGFSHGGPVHGGIETQPHDWVHGLVGGQDVQSPFTVGAMADPRTAGLDPIFWLHHTNIDRLWAAWNASSPGHTDPTQSTWLQGPASIGEREFCAPMPDGSTWVYTPGEMTDLDALDYTYEDITPTGVPPLPPVQDMAGSGVGGRAGLPGDRVPGDQVPADEAGGGAAVPEETNVELVGANDEAVPVGAAPVSSRVRLDPRARRRVADSHAGAGEADTEATPVAPDRVFLNLENVRGQSDATAFSVYVGVGDDEDPADHPELLAGSIAPFGVTQASDADDEHGGEGLTFVLEITEIVDRMPLAEGLDVDDLPVRIVPRRPVGPEGELEIGRISVFRQGR